VEKDTFDGNEPLFREPPEDIESDWYHGFLLGGMIAYGEFEVARSYRNAGDAVIAAAINDADLSHEWVYPAFFLYRHAIELYLKLVVQPTSKNHSLPDLIDSFESICKDELGLHVPAWVRQRLDEIVAIDPRSTSFRYSDVLDKNELANRGEWWVEFRHLKWLMNCLFDGFEKAHALRRSR
jgi:hypothetical protein